MFRDRKIILDASPAENLIPRHIQRYLPVNRNGRHIPVIGPAALHRDLPALTLVADQ
ncbi:hypothetical protein CNECB9_460019 [Cupriavidus necator]|uniref:Uncharacterized protein n=1 Tax=Cupriavidus necator TaxID=106590 RepID=A0A1K0JTT3_CUPNE|nr:hypothetical protein CNECB9_460019 [Cupriavidus necator]